jgi:hypothetical protein
MPKAGERDVELTRADAVAVADWLYHYRPRARGLGAAYFHTPLTAGSTDPTESELFQKFRSHSARKNAKGSIRLTVADLAWFAARAPRSSMFGRSAGVHLPPAVSTFCIACSRALHVKRGAPPQTARKMLAAAKIERLNGADGKRTKRRIRERIARSRELSERAKEYEGLGASYIKAFVQEFD